MSMLNRPMGRDEVGETVASTRDYAAAQKTVSKLITAEVPARDIAIVGQGVRSIERITGRLGYATAARSGAINGVLIGLLFSAFLVLGQPEAPIQLFFGVILVGVAFGMILSLISYAVVRRRRDYASVTQLSADHYEVTVKAASLAKARQALGTAQRTTVVRPPVDLSEPPKYGERIAPGAAAPGASPAGHTLPARTEPAPRYGERIVPTGAAAAAAETATPAAPEPEAPASDAPAPSTDAAAPSDHDATDRP